MTAAPDLEELRRLAEAVRPGPDHIWERAEFYSAVAPSVVLVLLDRIAALEAERDELAREHVVDLLQIDMLKILSNPGYISTLTAQRDELAGALRVAEAKVAIYEPHNCDGQFRLSGDPIADMKASRPCTGFTRSDEARRFLAGRLAPKEDK